MIGPAAVLLDLVALCHILLSRARGSYSEEGSAKPLRQTQAMAIVRLHARDGSGIFFQNLRSAESSSLQKLQSFFSRTQRGGLSHGLSFFQRHPSLKISREVLLLVATRMDSLLRISRLRKCRRNLHLLRRGVFDPLLHRGCCDRSHHTQ